MASLIAGVSGDELDDADVGAAGLIALAQDDSLDIVLADDGHTATVFVANLLDFRAPAQRRNICGPDLVTDTLSRRLKLW